MANYGLSEFAQKSVCPTNQTIRDNAGDGIVLPGAYVPFQSKTLQQLLLNGDGSVHPAFRVNGIQHDIVSIGKYQGSAHGSRIYSIAGNDPRANITLDTYERYCKNKGPGHHCLTWAEWALVALESLRGGTLPYGNNNYGKDSRETGYEAIPSMARDADGRVQRVGTGTGPETWSHNHKMSGVFDMNGNIWQWIVGIRLWLGELQLIPYNDAADPDCDTSATSNAWRAINAKATSYNDLWLTPNGNGTTGNSVKLNYSSNRWVWQTSISDAEDNSRSASFQSTTASGLNAFPTMFLQAAALLPEEGVDYQGDVFYANNGAEERCAFRGGYWGNGATAGVFSLYFDFPRSNSRAGLGGRPAFVELETAA